jgi:hypothetical protein
MKRLVFSILIVSLVSCSKNPEAFIPYLNGYWEINEVTLPDGNKKIFSFNETVDYIQITDSLTGFRKKLSPKITGGFESSLDAEMLKVKIENDSLNLYYSTAYAKWKETVLSASENELLIINKNKVRYLYKRYQPLDLNDDQTP